MSISFNLHALAHACGGDIDQDHALVPGPDRGPDDRSLAIRLDPGGPDGFLVLSFRGRRPDALQGPCAGRAGERSERPARHPYSARAGHSP